MSRAAWLVAGTLAVGHVLGTATPAAAPTAITAQATTPVHRGCAIRFDTLSSTGNSVVPRIHENSGHKCYGVTDVRVDWGGNKNLIIENDLNPTAVSTISITEDETLTQRGISCGPSGGGNLTHVICYDREGKWVPGHSLELYGVYSNLWFYAMNEGPA